MPPCRPRVIAVTGAGGFLGGAVLAAWQNHPQISSIRALFCRKSQVPEGLSEKVDVHVGDLSRPEVAEHLVDGAESVLHFANRGFPLDPVAVPGDTLIQNIAISSSLLEAISKNPQQHLVLASSGGAIYKPLSPRRPFVETDPVEYRTPYALCKLSIENLVQHYSLKRGISATILRLTNPFGPGQLGRSRQGFVGVAFEKILSSEKMPIWGDLSTSKDFIYVDDVILALEACTFRQSPLNGIYNLGTETATSLAEALATIEKVTGKRFLSESMPQRSGDAPWTVVNTAKFRDHSGWKPTLDFEQACRMMWEHLISMGVDRKSSAA